MSRRPNRTRFLTCSEDVLRSQTSTVDLYVKFFSTTWNGCPAPCGDQLQLAFQKDVVLIPEHDAKTHRWLDTDTSFEDSACEPAYIPVRKSHRHGGMDQAYTEELLSTTCSPPVSWESLPSMASLLETPPPMPPAVANCPVDPYPSPCSEEEVSSVEKLVEKPEATAAPQVQQQQAPEAVSGASTILFLALAILFTALHTARAALTGRWQAVSTSMWVAVDVAMAAWGVSLVQAWHLAPQATSLVEQQSIGLGSVASGRWPVSLACVRRRQALFGVPVAILLRCMLLAWDLQHGR